MAEASSVFFTAPREEDPTKIDPSKVGRARRYPWTGRGDVNTYALFAEHFLNLRSPLGQAGLIVPSGIATDATTAPFFEHLVKHRQICSLHDFQTGLGFFDRIGHARFKFCLLTLGKLASSERMEFSFFSRTLEEFEDPKRHIQLTPSEISAINPNTKNLPIFRTKFDADLTAKIHGRVPVLIEEGTGSAGTPWGVSFMRMFDMSGDSGLFRTADQLSDVDYILQGSDWARDGGARPGQKSMLVVGDRSASHRDLSTGTREADRYVPLYEAKMIHQFDHRWATYDGTDSGHASLAEKIDPDFVPVARYWVPKSEVTNRLQEKEWSHGWLMGWRDICRATDERTLIASAFPTTAVGDKLLLLFSQKSARESASLLGSLNSLTCDYVARQKLGGSSLKYFIFKQLPILPPSAYAETVLGFGTHRSWTGNCIRGIPPKTCTVQNSRLGHTR